MGLRHEEVRPAVAKDFGLIVATELLSKELEIVV